MSLCVGQPVRWIKTGIVTQIRSIESVDRGVFGSIQCAVLECNRFVPLSELQAFDQSETQEPFEKRTTSKRAADVDDGFNRPAAADDEPWFGKPATQSGKPKAESRKPVPKPETVASSLTLAVPCDVLAIDFMNLLVRAFHAGKPTETHAVRSMFQTVASAVRQLRPARLVFAFEAGHEHRSKLLPEYKAHRPPQAPELRSQIDLAKKAIQIAGLAGFSVEGWEADDVLASIVERFPCVVICSSDKDLLSLHGRARIFHPWTGGGFVDPESKLGVSAGQVTDFLSLCGDTSDGIPGVKGIGPKTAVSLLQDFESLEGILVAAMSGQIPGSTGTKLKEQRNQALLCQQVVQLRASLPLPELSPWTPPAGYQKRLQDLGLGSVAAVLDGLLPHFANTPQKEGLPASASTAEEEPGGRQQRSDAGRGVGAAARLDRPSQDEGLPEAVHTNGDPAANSTEDTGLPAAVDDPVSGSAAWLRVQYEQGRKYAEYARSGRQVENPWRRDSAQFVAWDQGFRGVPFDPSGGLF